MPDVRHLESHALSSSETRFGVVPDVVSDSSHLVRNRFRKPHVIRTFCRRGRSGEKLASWSSCGADLLDVVVLDAEHAVEVGAGPVVAADARQRVVDRPSRGAWNWVRSDAGRDWRPAVASGRWNGASDDAAADEQGKKCQHCRSHGVAFPRARMTELDAESEIIVPFHTWLKRGRRGCTVINDAWGR